MIKAALTHRLGIKSFKQRKRSDRILTSEYPCPPQALRQISTPAAHCSVAPALKQADRAWSCEQTIATYAENSKSNLHTVDSSTASHTNHQPLAIPTSRLRWRASETAGVFLSGTEQPCSARRRWLLEVIVCAAGSCIPWLELLRHWSKKQSN